MPEVLCCVSRLAEHTRRGFVKSYSVFMRVCGELAGFGSPGEDCPGDVLELSFSSRA